MRLPVPRFVVLAVCLSLLLAACGGSASTSTTTTSTSSTAAPTATSAATATTASTPAAAASSPAASPSATTPAAATATAGTPVASGPLVKVELDTGFLPSMNFAPYYLAAAKGYYAAQGLDVTIKDGANPGLLEQIAGGGMVFGITGGDSLITARAAGIPDVLVLQQFQKYPVGLITLANGGAAIAKPADLKGKKIGVSAPNGSTYFGLLALLQAANLTKDDVTIVSIGFTELEALSQKRVDGAMTFITNEPIQARDQGIPVNQLAVSDYVNLVSTGLVTSEKLVAEHPDIVQKFVTASLQGLAEAQRDPDAAYAASIKRMQELSPAAAKTQRDILTATLGFEQQPSGHPYGWSDPDAWTTTINLLKSVGVITKDVDASSCYTNTFVENARP